MYINSNDIPSQNQLTIGGVTHKLIYMLKPFNFINAGQHPLSYSLYFYQCGTIPTFILQHTPSRAATNKTQYVHTILMKRRR